MADPPPTAHMAGQGLIIPDELRKKYPELIDLVLASESMNDEERQYWINILPIMTPEQIENLRGILVNEREQLAAIDKKYAKEIQKIGQKNVVHQTEEERRKRRTDLASQESAAEVAEEGTAEDLLKKINEA